MPPRVYEVQAQVEYVACLGPLRECPQLLGDELHLGQGRDRERGDPELRHVKQRIPHRADKVLAHAHLELR